MSRIKRSHAICNDMSDVHLCVAARDGSKSDVMILATKSAIIENNIRYRRNDMREKPFLFFIGIIICMCKNSFFLIAR